VNDAPSLVLGERVLHVVGAAILDEEGRCLVARRAPHVTSAGLWEFPGGKVEAGEKPRRALEREIAEELGLTIRALAFLGRGEAREPTRTIVLDVYLAEFDSSASRELRLTDHDEVRFISAAEIAGLEWAAADVPVLPALEARLISGWAPRW